MASLKEAFKKQPSTAEGKIKIDKRSALQDDWSLDDALQNITDKSEISNLDGQEIIEEEVLENVVSPSSAPTPNVSKVKSFPTNNNTIVQESTNLSLTNQRFDPTLNIRSPQTISPIVAHYVIKLQTSLRNQGFKNSGTSESRIMDQYLRKAFGLPRDDSKSDLVYREALDFFQNNPGRVIIPLTAERQKDLRLEREAKKVAKIEAAVLAKHGIKK